MDEDSAKRYRSLSKYNMRQLHLWAADGLAQMCYLTYADQPSGLGPDELFMQGTSGGEWIAAVEKWKNSGGRGSPPGVGIKKPVPSAGDQEGVQRVPSANISRDYTLKKNGYLLRPEVGQCFAVLLTATTLPAFYSTHCWCFVIDCRIVVYSMAHNGGSTMAGVRVGNLPSA
jgi:hypothetical protein